MVLDKQELKDMLALIEQESRQAAIDNKTQDSLDVIPLIDTLKLTLTMPTGTYTQQHTIQLDNLRKIEAVKPVNSEHMKRLTTLWQTEFDVWNKIRRDKGI